MGLMVILVKQQTNTFNVAPEKVLCAFLLFSLFNFSYLYFFSFDEGVSGAPFYVQALKDGVYLVLLIALFPSINFTTDWREWIFLPLGITLVATSLIHAPHTGLKDQVWQNIKNVALFIPIYQSAFWMQAEQRNWLMRGIFSVLLFASVVQCIFSLLYYYSGHKLWLDGVLAGLVGNPNSFSLVLNLAFSVILAFTPAMSRKLFATSLVIVALIFYTMLFTNSGSQFAVFIFLIGYAAIIMREKRLRFAIVALIATTVSLVNNTATDNTLFTLSGIPQAIRALPADMNAGPELKAGLENVSGSVTARVEVVRRTLSIFANPADATFGSFSAELYTPMDGQFFVFLYNGGLLLLLPFAAASAYVYLTTLVRTWRLKNPSLAALHFMIAAFGITFLASRVLMYFPLNFIFFLICGLAVTFNQNQRDPGRV